LNIGRSASR